MTNDFTHQQKYVNNIKKSGISIYDRIEVGDPDLWIPYAELEALLNDGLRGMSGLNLPIRTRSKIIKQAICRVLGYPVPKTFQKTQPRFLGQYFDVYGQKSNNLQIWNEEIELTRRYVIIRISESGEVEKVRVITGEELAPLDTTGTLTQKYQARLTPGQAVTELIAPEDTDNLKPLVNKNSPLRHFNKSPIDYPTTTTLLPIEEIYERLGALVGATFTDIGYDQERLRGAGLHRMVCQRLGYDDYQDDGRFPDVRNQLLEVKLQTSSTIDLGLIKPDSEEPLDIPKIENKQVRHCDVRYAMFYARTDGEVVTLTHFYLTTGESFFRRFQQFQGKVTNKKIQLHLPGDFFE